MNLSLRGKYHHRRVHSLVAEAFLGPRPDGMEVCHGDGDPSNNALSNLRYDTRKANQADMVRHGVSSASKLSRPLVRAMRELRGRRRQREIAAEFGVSDAVVSQIMTGKIWRNA